MIVSSPKGSFLKSPVLYPLNNYVWGVVKRLIQQWLHKMKYLIKVTVMKVLANMNKNHLIQDHFSVISSFKKCNWFYTSLHHSDQIIYVGSLTVQF